MNLTNFDQHRRSNNRQYGFPTTRLHVCASPWSRPQKCQWYWERVFFWHVELRSRFDVMTPNHLQLTRNHCGFLRHLLFHLSVETSPNSPEGLLWDLHSLQVGPSLEWILGLLHLFQTMLLLHLRLGRLKQLPLRWAFGHEFLTRPNFPAPRMSAANKSPLQIPAANDANPRNLPGITFSPNRWSLDWPFAEIGWYPPIAPSGMTRPFLRFSKSPFTRCFPICQEVLNISQMTIAFHRISPTLCIQAWLQQYRRGPFIYAAYRSFSYAIRFGSMGCWSTMIPR